MLHIIQDPWLSPRSAKSNPRKRSNGGGTGLNLSILNNMDVLRNKLLRELMARNQVSSNFILNRLNSTSYISGNEFTQPNITHCSPVMLITYKCNNLIHLAGTERICVAVREEPEHPRKPRLKRTKLKRREEY